MAWSLFLDLDRLALDSPSATATADPAETPQTASTARIEDLGAVGTAARSILGKANFTKIVVELIYVEGRQPSQKAMSHFVDTLHKVTGKHIVQAPSIVVHSEGDVHTIQEIQNISLARSFPSIAPVISIVVASLNGSLADGRYALGGTVGATVIALFPDKIKNLSAKPETLEAATLVHELGHTLDLVNLDYQSPRQREHPDHRGHSKNPNSVMYWSVDRISGDNQLSPPQYFDEDDLADLADLGAGRL